MTVKVNAARKTNGMQFQSKVLVHKIMLRMPRGMLRLFIFFRNTFFIRYVQTLTCTVSAAAQCTGAYTAAASQRIAGSISP